MWNGECHHGKVIVRVHTVYLMNVVERQAAANHQTKPTHLGCECICRLLLTTLTIQGVIAASAVKHYSALVLWHWLTAVNSRKRSSLVTSIYVQ